MRYIPILLLSIILIPSLSYAQYNIQQIETYLNSIKTFSATFKQYDHNGAIKSGKFFLSKPGKMKWEYLSPTKTVLITNNDNMVYCDYELEEVSYFHTKSILAHFLSQKKVDLQKDVKIDEFINSDQHSSITVSPKTEETNSNISNLTLLFEHEKSNLNHHSLLLKQINITYENGHEAKVIFSNIKVNTAISNSEFIFRNPNFFNILK